MATIQLVYTTPRTILPSAKLAAAVAAAPIQDSLAAYGLPIQSDATTTAGDGTVVRTITLNVTADGQTYFPTDTAKKQITRGLYEMQLRLGTPAFFSAEEPVVVP